MLRVIFFGAALLAGEVNGTSLALDWIHATRGAGRAVRSPWSLMGRPRAGAAVGVAGHREGPQGRAGGAVGEYRNRHAKAERKRYECYALQSVRNGVSCCRPNG